MTTMLGPSKFIRPVYRTLINTGRAHAAFTEEDHKIFQRLIRQGPVLDPMSGYGLTTQWAVSAGLSSYCLEYNLPQYYWQLLTSPLGVQANITACDVLLRVKGGWPKATARAVASNDWFPPESVDMLVRLYDLCCDSIRKALEGHPITSKDVGERGLALMLPFSGRFCCSIEGNVAVHVKKGGLCVYRDWESDFVTYLQSLKHRLNSAKHSNRPRGHSTVYGDAREHVFPAGRFRSLVTSPPYPNHQDFASIFEPEHAAISILHTLNKVQLPVAPGPIIGSNYVSGRTQRTPRTKCVNAFLDRVSSLPKSGGAKYDDEVYYLPYLKNYFSDLELAFENTAKALAQQCSGMIVVVDNTHRGVVVPVASAVVEMWQTLGFDAIVLCETERNHVGSKNPRAKGSRARHMHSVLQVSRG